VLQNADNAPFRVAIAGPAACTDHELLRHVRAAVPRKRAGTPMYKFLYMPDDFDLKTARLVT